MTVDWVISYLVHTKYLCHAKLSLSVSLAPRPSPLPLAHFLSCFFMCLVTCQERIDA